MWLSRSRDLRSWEQARDDDHSYPFLQPSSYDAGISPYANAAVNVPRADPTGSLAIRWPRHDWSLVH